MIQITDKVVTVAMDGHIMINNIGNTLSFQEVVNEENLKELRSGRKIRVSDAEEFPKVIIEFGDAPMVDLVIRLLVGTRHNMERHIEFMESGLLRDIVRKQEKEIEELKTKLKQKK